MNEVLAPIILFVYNRPVHTERTVKSLANNYLASDSDLYIYSDAPKGIEAEEGVNQVRNFIKNIKGFKSITIVEREINFGLVKSITEGVTEIVNRFGKVIVVEDDLITHKQFLEFLNAGLERYKNEPDVYEITGYSHINDKNFINNGSAVENPSYFLKITSTWGWATWDDKWRKFKEGLAGIEHLYNNGNLKRQFNYDNSYNYFRMVKNTQKGKVKSWGIVWYWNIFKQQGLTLYPYYSLVDQIGFDGTGQNAKNYLIQAERIKQSDYEFLFPKQIEESSFYKKRVVGIIKRRKRNIILKIIFRILRINQF